MVLMNVSDIEDFSLVLMKHVMMKQFEEKMNKGNY